MTMRHPGTPRLAPTPERTCPRCGRPLRIETSFIEGLPPLRVQHDRFTWDPCKATFEAIGSPEAELEPLDHLPDRAMRRRPAHPAVRRPGDV